MMDHGNTCEQCGLAINTDQCQVCGKHRPCCGHHGLYCIISPQVQVGEGTRIWHYVKIGWERPGQPDVIIGRNCSIGNYVEIGPGVQIGDGTHVGADSQLHHPATIGRQVFIAPGVMLSNDKYPSLEAAFVPQPVTIGDHAIIGIGAIIVGGVTVGEAAFVAAGAVVTKDVPPRSMVWGLPAREFGVRHPHYPGTAMEHWGPICNDQRCTTCEGLGLDQYEAGA